MRDQGQDILWTYDWYQSFSRLPLQITIGGGGWGAQGEHTGDWWIPLTEGQ